ncbi:hypothetical protein ACQB6R_03165 [Propionibacteriaceae bacterium G1746]
MTLRVLLVLLLVAASSAGAIPAHAKGDKENHWQTDATNRDDGAEITAHLKLKDTTGNNPDTDSTRHNTVNGKTAAELDADLQRYYAELAARCRFMFVDAQSKAALATDGAILVRNTYMRQCLDPSSTNWNLPPNPPPNPAVLGAEAVARLHIPNPEIQIGPDPSRNRWKSAFVGYPLWISTPGEAQFQASASVRGHTVALTARRVMTRIGMGDGTVLSCATTTQWRPAVTPEMHSPTCGHVYQEPSTPGSYRLRAVESWQVTWAVLGQSGTIPVTLGSSRALRVGELSAVLVPEP